MAELHDELLALRADWPATPDLTEAVLASAEPAPRRRPRWKPALAALLAVPVLGERLPRRGWAGMALAFAGVALIGTGAGGGIRFEPMALLGLGAAAASAAYFVFQKPWLARYGALDLTAYGVWTGAAAMLVFAPDLPRTLAAATAPALLAVLYLGLVPTALGYMLWTYALARAAAGRVSSLLYLEPIATFVSMPV